MRKLYSLAILSVLISSSGCSKDFLKSYDHRILGTWKIIDIDRYGFNGADALPFEVSDLFTFEENGKLTYQKGGKIYQGSWDIRRETNSDQDEKSLNITAIDFSSQQVITEYFNNMKFTSTNRFTAFINYNSRTYVYRFLRQ